MVTVRVEGVLATHLEKLEHTVREEVRLGLHVEGQAHRGPGSRRWVLGLGLAGLGVEGDQARQRT